MKIRQWFIVLFALFSLLIPTVVGLRKGYMLRKGSRLEHEHRRILHGWRNAYKHHKLKRSDHFEDLLSRMDKLIRPRFG